MARFTAKVKSDSVKTSLAKYVPNGLNRGLYLSIF